MFLLKRDFCCVLIKIYLRKFFRRFTAECNQKLFSGKHTLTHSGKNLPELQFRCGSGAFTPEICLNFRIPEPGSGKFTRTFFSVLSERSRICGQFQPEGFEMQNCWLILQRSARRAHIWQNWTALIARFLEFRIQKFSSLFTFFLLQFQIHNFSRK